MVVWPIDLVDAGNVIILMKTRHVNSLMTNATAIMLRFVFGLSRNKNRFYSIMYLIGN